MRNLLLHLVFFIFYFLYNVESHNDQIIHILQEYDLAIAELSTDITTLEASKKEYTDALALLQSKKDDLEAHKAEIGDWASNFDGLIGTHVHFN